MAHVLLRMTKALQLKKRDESRNKSGLRTSYASFRVCFGARPVRRDVEFLIFSGSGLGDDKERVETWIAPHIFPCCLTQFLPQKVVIVASIRVGNVLRRIVFPQFESFRKSFAGFFVNTLEYLARIRPIVGFQNLNTSVASFLLEKYFLLRQSIALRILIMSLGWPGVQTCTEHSSTNSPAVHRASVWSR